MFAGNKEDFYGYGPVSCLPKNSDHNEYFCKIAFSLVGTLPTHDVRPSHPEHSKTHWPLFTWKCAAWHAWEDCLPVSLGEEAVVTLLSGWLAQSVERLPG